MAIEQKQFDNERELHTWVEHNIQSFFGEVIYIPGNFMITTKRNKGCKPDGLVLDLANSSWTIVESELLRHGVWEHIAEQIMRIIVASANDPTKRKIRNAFFDFLEEKNLIASISTTLSISPPKLIQKIENILESQTPDIAIFIDDVSEDLQDMVEALNATVKVFRIQKYIVNGAVEYLAPEGTKTLIETSIEEVKDARGDHARALELVGGGHFSCNVGNIRLYALDNGEKVSIKYSKYYDTDQAYWYGITPTTLEKYEKQGITHLVFILGTEGVIKLPFETLKEYLIEANKSLNPDGSIRHYHVFVKNEPEHLLFIKQDKPTWKVKEHFYPSEA